MTTDTWHAPTDLLHRYAAGSLAASAEWAVEQHVAACAACRGTAATVAEEVHGAELTASWVAVDDRVLAGEPSAPQRLLEACGVPRHLAVRLTATPRLVAAFLAGAVLALAAAVVAAHVLPSPFTAAPEGRLLWFLLLAPGVPAAGVAVAFGVSGDPAGEVAVTMPSSGATTLLARSAAATLVAVPLSALAALLLPAGAGAVAFAWLLPAVAVTAVTIAGSAVVAVRHAAALAWGTWAVGVLGAEVAGDVPLAAATAAGQVVVAVIVVLAAGVAVAGRERLEVAR